MDVPNVTRNCGTCRLRRRDEGGTGTCPQKGVMLLSFQERSKGGKDNGCWRYDQRSFLSRAASRELALRPQEAALF